MDDDEDGLVEQAEFIEHSTKLLSDPELAGQVYAALDTDADGGIPVPEYLRVWGRSLRGRRLAAGFCGHLQYWHGTGGKSEAWEEVLRCEN